MGVVVRDTTSDMMMAADRVTENSRNRRPTMPPISSRGINTATREVLMDRTVKVISRDPMSAASRGEWPISR